MEDIKIKDLCGQWKTVLILTVKFIWNKIVEFSKWLWVELNKFAKGSTWITVAVILGLFVSIFNSINEKRQHKWNTIEYTMQIDSLQYIIDSLKVNNITDQLLMKAGEYTITAHHETNDITKDSAASLLVNLGAWYPDVILAQVQVESGFGTSDVARNTNNMLGMKKTGSRKTTQIKNTDYCGYGKYTNWESCLIDRVMWDYEVFGPNKPSRNEYIEKLNARYGEAEGYGYSMDRYSTKYMKYL